MTERHMISKIVDKTINIGNVYTFGEPALSVYATFLILFDK